MGGRFRSGSELSVRVAGCAVPQSAGVDLRNKSGTIWLVALLVIDVLFVLLFFFLGPFVVGNVGFCKGQRTEKGFPNT